MPFRGTLVPLQVDRLGTLAGSLRSAVSGKVDRDVPLVDLTTYRIGGPASILVSPMSSDDVVAVVRACAQEEVPWLALGLGSNVLMSDAGFAGVVIRLGKGLDQLEADSKDEHQSRWIIGAGMPIPRLARLSAEAGWAGIHRLIGVPGTVGGGVFMNAGAHGQDFSQVVCRVDVVTAAGRLEHLDAASLPWAYRDAGIRDAIVVGCHVHLERAPIGDLKLDIRKHFRWRQRGTPFKEKCCGSVFRNPGALVGGERRTAGQLIDASGLKGFACGGAKVSERHANYIVNTGSATAADVRAVIDAVRERVQLEFEVELRLEVKLLGD